MIQYELLVEKTGEKNFVLVDWAVNTDQSMRVRVLIGESEKREMDI